MENLTGSRNEIILRESFNRGTAQKSILDVFSTCRLIKWSGMKDYLQEIDDSYGTSNTSKMYWQTLNPESLVYQLNVKAEESKKYNPELNIWRTENIFYMSEEEDEYYDEKNWSCETKWSPLLETIQNQYQKAMAKHSSYSANLARHVGTGNGIVYAPFINDTSVLVWQLEWDIFLVSHFSPSSMKMGYELIKQALNTRMPIIFTVPEFLSKQLEKIWFKKLEYTVPQFFNGNIMMKNVLVNHEVREKDLQELIEMYMDEYGLTSI